MKNKINKKNVITLTLLLSHAVTMNITYAKSNIVGTITGGNLKGVVGNKNAFVGKDTSKYLGQDGKLNALGEEVQKCELNKNKLATMAAIAFGALAAERWVAVAKFDKTVKEVEKMLDNLISQAPTNDTTGGGGGGQNGGGFSGGFGGGFSGGGTGTPGTTTASGGGGNGGGWGSSDDAFGNSFGATAGDGLDNHMLQGQLGRRLADKLDKSGLSPGKIAKMLETGGPSAASSGVLAAMGLPSTMTPTIAGTAKQIQNMGGSLYPTSYAASGGASGPSTTAHNEPNLLDGMDLAQGGREPASMDFVPANQQAVDENDIWHSGSSDNIFQIVSKRIGVSSNRLGQ